MAFYANSAALLFLAAGKCHQEWMMAIQPCQALFSLAQCHASALQTIANTKQSLWINITHHISIILSGKLLVSLEPLGQIITPEIKGAPHMQLFSSCQSAKHYKSRLFDQYMNFTREKNDRLEHIE